MTGKAGSDATSNTPLAMIETTRTHFRTLIAANPNYFGTLKDSAFEPADELSNETQYEGLATLGYNPARRQLHATFEIKRPTGYSGDLCDEGSTEYVRFFANDGGGWTDVGLVATAVHDIPVGKDCDDDPLHPLTYAVEVPYAPGRRWCTAPQLPLVRAILSWDLEPPAGEPDWSPVYGDVLDCNVQIDKTGVWIGSLIEAVQTVVKLPPSFLATIPDLPTPTSAALASDGIFGPETEPEAPVLPELAVADLLDLYSVDDNRGDFSVEPERFTFATATAIKASADGQIAQISGLTQLFEPLQVDLLDLLGKIEDTTGNIDYEELEDVALDWNKEKLVATYRVKRANGFSGNLCTGGSTQYIAFWADWQDECEWTYLDTVQVKSYDFEDLPDGGLCYSASLAVDLSAVRRLCSDPRISRVRAVLSWNSAPSMTDPDDVPTWGNRLDAHVLIPPGPPVGPVRPLLSDVGGIGVADISNSTGRTSPTARFVLNGLRPDNLGRDCPFGGRVVLGGVAFPGHKYRAQSSLDGGASWQTLDRKIWIIDKHGVGSYHLPDSDGWFNYRSHDHNAKGILAYFDTGRENGMAIVRLEIQGMAGSVSQRVYLDNNAPEVDVSLVNPIDCGTMNPGDALSGTFKATDAFMGGWSVKVDGGPVGFGPVTLASGTTNRSAGSPWAAADTSDLEPCGYIVRVTASDRSILNSASVGRSTSVDVGFCVNG